VRLTRTDRRGMTLIEILLATFILVSVLLPIGGLIFGGAQSSSANRSFNVGANIAANVMDQLLSSEVPFRAIDIEGGPTVGDIMGASGLGDAAGLDGPISGAEGIKTAAFTGEFTALEDKIFGALGQPTDVGGCKRVIYDKGYMFEVFWFAGTYKDQEAGTADYKKELTFCFFKNPYVPVDQTEAKRVVLSNSTLSPYNAVSVPVSDPVFGPIDNPKDPRSRPGWPVLSDYETEPNYEQIVTKVDGGGVNLDYPLVFTDLEEFNESNGGLMKLIVGVRWAPKHKGQGLGKQQRTHEFWLVSVKGRIEEG